MTDSAWQTVALPKELLEIIDEIIRDGTLGYTSKAEFIKEAIRERLLILEQAGYLKNKNSKQ